MLVREREGENFIMSKKIRMSDPKDFKFSLKALINKQKTKVLYVEADNDFVDVLLSFLTLPLGTIVRVLNKHYGSLAPVIGSLTTLYNGLQNMDDGLFSREDYKNLLLNPISSSEVECRRLKINVDDSQPTKFFKCGSTDCRYRDYPTVSMYYSGLKCKCGNPLDKEIYVKDLVDDDGGVFIRSKSYFIITDDLQILPIGMGAAVKILLNLGITDTVGIEERNLTFGLNEIMDLLKGSLFSGSLFTEYILHEKSVNCVAVNCETAILPADMIKQLKETCRTMQMTVKAILSANKLLYAEVNGDFVDFLFSLLAIPLGGVEHRLGKETCLKTIDNLYKSIANLRDHQCLTLNCQVKNPLLQPKLPFCYNLRTHFLSPTQNDYPVLYFHPSEEGGCLSPLSSFNSSNGIRTSTYKFSEGQLTYTSYGTEASSFKFPEGQGKYVKRPAMFMVTDDLTVTPIRSSLPLSILNNLNVSLSDVKELELVIGIEEALSILKASLTSSRALTNGLINPALIKQMKQEGS